jgi:hypothetical protein
MKVLLFITAFLISNLSFAVSDSYSIKCKCSKGEALCKRDGFVPVTVNPSHCGGSGAMVSHCRQASECGPGANISPVRFERADDSKIINKN